MATTHFHKGLMLAALTCFLLVGCKTLPTEEEKQAQVKEQKEQREQREQRELKELEITKALDATAAKEQELKQVLEIYWEGRYEEAITKLTPLATAPELPLSSQIKAIKLMAFSNCVLSRLPACRKNFSSALQQDPTFRLDAAEKGHPVWGKQFELALAESQKRAEVIAKQEVAPVPAPNETKTDAPVAGENNPASKPKRPNKK